jgi:superfamily II DNA or RNA helicase
MTTLAPRSIHAQHILDETYGVEPRPYQIRTVDKVLDHYLEGLPSVLIESATGSGKTVMGLVIAKALNGMGLTVGWCAMRRNLLTQAEDSNREKNIKADIKTFSMFDKNPPKVDVIIVDEAHHDACSSMATIHAAVNPKFIVGLSATPQRHDKVGLVFRKTVKEAGLYDLVRDQYLAKADLFMVKNWTPETVAKTYLERPEHWGKSLMFFRTEDLCREAEARLSAEGIPVAVVTGKTDKMKQLEDFEAGLYDVLISMNVLTEGFDCPALETVFVRPTVKGLTMQMAGRVLRKHGKTKKKIVQSVDTENPFSAIAPVGRQHIKEDDRWTSMAEADRVTSEIRRIKRELVEEGKTGHLKTLEALKSGLGIAENEVLRKSEFKKSRRPHWAA